MFDVFQTPHGKRDIELEAQAMRDASDRFIGVLLVFALGFLISAVLLAGFHIVVSDVIEHQLDVRDGLL